jgi:hypothetical protein
MDPGPGAGAVGHSGMVRQQLVAGHTPLARRHPYVQPADGIHFKQLEQLNNALMAIQ